MPTAIAYLRSDVSGVRQSWDEIRNRGCAKRRGDTLSKTIVFSRRVEDPIGRLIEAVRRAGAQSVVVPSLAHFDGTVPAALLAEADVITVDPYRIYTVRAA